MASARPLLAATQAALAATALSSDFAILSLSPGGAIASPRMMAWIAIATLPNSSGVNSEALKISTVFGHFAAMRLPYASLVMGGFALLSLFTPVSYALSAASLFR